MAKSQIKIPPKLKPMFLIPRGQIRYRCSFGGRGSGKSQTFAKMAAVFGYREKLKILCCREFQASIKDSFYAEVKNAIESEPFLNAFYSVGVNFIRGANGTEFIFAGLRNNIASIKSLSGIDICICEESETIPEYSWRDLIPTIRKPSSELWVIWNPCKKDSPVDVRFRQKTDSDMAVVEINYNDNPFFPDTLEAERKRDLKNLDDSVYQHIWEGAYLEISDAQVLKNKYKIAEFEPKDYWHGAYLGCDFGFSQDPTTLVKSWIFENTLYIEYEAWGVGVEIDHLPQLFQSVLDSKNYVIYADSARPETISYLRRQGYNIRPSKKGKGSVLDGVAHLRSYDTIVIHPRCVKTIEEARLWSYKVDKLSGDVLPVLASGYDHIFDAVRYSLEPIMRSGSKGVSITTPSDSNNSIW